MDIEERKGRDVTGQQGDHKKEANRTMTSDSELYIVSEAPSSPCNGPPGYYTLVALFLCSDTWPSESSLRERFGLSRQEARVALLLAQRMTTQEIKEELCVSIFTARHHVENVMTKLGVRSRRNVAELLQSSPS